MPASAPYTEEGERGRKRKGEGEKKSPSNTVNKETPLLEVMVGFSGEMERGEKGGKRRRPSIILGCHLLFDAGKVLL